MNKQTKRNLDRVQRDIASSVVIGKIIQAKNGLAKASFLPGEVHDSIPLVQHFGFASMPPRETPCLAVNNGNREKMAIVNTIGQAPATLKEGDACLYSTKSFICLSGSTVSISNGTSDLVALLSKLCECLLTATVLTESGPKPLSTIADIGKLKGAIDAFIAR